MPITTEMNNALFQQKSVLQCQPARVLHTIEALPQTAKYHVGAYCRVSTDSEQQEGSLIVQRDHFLTVIAENPDLEYVDIYYERGISGTKKETRPELQRLLRDCRSGKVNLVLTKSISRFARNLTDCLEMVRELNGLGVHLVFEKERIDTRLVDSEFIMTILAVLAEDESHSFSDNNRWAIQKRFQNGTYRPAVASYGYDLVDGRYVINEEEEAVVKEIFHRYLMGEGSKAIADRLRKRGVPTKRTGQLWQGKEMTFAWSSSSVIKILQNIHYVGDALLQKSFHDENFRLVPNKGEMPKYHIHDRHPEIISRETFQKVQELLAQRKKEHGRKNQRAPHLLTGKLRCGCCGAPMYRATGKKGAPNKYQWLCKRHHEDATACGMKAVLEDSVLNCWQTMVNKLRFASVLLTCFAEAKEKAWRMAHQDEIAPLEMRLFEIDKEKRANQMAYTEGRVDQKTFLQERNCLDTEERIAQADLKRMSCPEAEEVRRFKTAVMEQQPYDALLTEYVKEITCLDRFTYRFTFGFGLSLTEETDAKDYNNYGKMPGRKTE